MLFEVEFAIKANNVFCTIYTAFVEAVSVSECRRKAKEIMSKVKLLKDQEIYIFIAA